MRKTIVEKVTKKQGARQNKRAPKRGAANGLAARPKRLGKRQIVEKKVMMPVQSAMIELFRKFTDVDCPDEIIGQVREDTL